MSKQVIAQAGEDIEAYGDCVGVSGGVSKVCLEARPRQRLADEVDVSLDADVADAVASSRDEARRGRDSKGFHRGQLGCFCCRDPCTAVVLHALLM